MVVHRQSSCVSADSAGNHAQALSFPGATVSRKQVLMGTLSEGRGEQVGMMESGRQGPGTCPEPQLHGRCRAAQSQVQWDAVTEGGQCRPLAVGAGAHTGLLEVQRHRVSLLSADGVPAVQSRGCGCLGVHVHPHMCTRAHNVVVVVSVDPMQAVMWETAEPRAFAFLGSL